MLKDNRVFVSPGTRFSDHPIAGSVHSWPSDPHRFSYLFFFLVADKLFRMSSLISFHRLPPDNSDYRKKLSHFIIYYLFLFLSNYRKKLWLVNCLYVNIYIIFCPCLTIEKKLWFINCLCVIYIYIYCLAIEKICYLLIVYVSTYIRFR